MEITKKLFNALIIFVTIVAVVFIGCFVYFKVSSKGLFTNQTSTYATKVTDPFTGEDLSPLSASYYQNYNNTGKEVLEFQIRAYSDQKKQAIYRRGFQYVIDKEQGNRLYYYDTYDGKSWESLHKLDEENEVGQLREGLFIECDNNLVGLRIDGTYQTKEHKVNGGNIAGNILLGPLWWIFKGFYKDLTTDTITTHYYTMEEFLNKLAIMVKSCSAGTGDYTLPVVDFGDFMHLYEVAEDGEISDKPIGNGGQINSYFTIDIHSDRRGMTYAGQSMFNVVEDDPDFNISGVDYDAEYWKITTVYNLTEQDFEARYSTADLGFYYTLSATKINELKNFNKLDINIVFDISKIKNVNVLGFDYYALNGIKVNSLTIKSDKQRDFTLLVGSLKDTGLTKINTNNVKINNLSGSEVAYEMV